MFSQACIDLVLKEAAAAGLSGSTPISIALREQLVDTRKGVDTRTKDFYVAGRVVDNGVSTPLPGPAHMIGWAGLSALAQGAQGHVTGAVTLADECAKPYAGTARVNMSRGGTAHVNILLPHSKMPPETPTAWVDLYVYRTLAEATAKAKEIPTGKVF